MRLTSLSNLESSAAYVSNIQAGECGFFWFWALVHNNHDHGFFRDFIFLASRRIVHRLHSPLASSCARASSCACDTFTLRVYFASSLNFCKKFSFLRMDRFECILLMTFCRRCFFLRRALPFHGNASSRKKA